MLWACFFASFVTVGCLAQNLPPVLTDDMNQAVVSESTAVGSQVYTLKAEDPEGSPVRFRFEGTDAFQVDPQSGVVTLVQALDREVTDTLRFAVVVEDTVEGQPKNVVRIPVSVIVSDENDIAPVFQNESYEVIVAENAPIGTTVLRGISASDLDLVGDTLEVFCREQSSASQNDCSHFEIVTESANSTNYLGSLIVKSILNHTQQATYLLQLVVSDGLHNSTAWVNIRLEDVQNSPPYFVSSRAALISENASVGSVVMTIKAKDGDMEKPRSLFYELVSNLGDYFLLDSNNGELRVARALDRESLDESGTISLRVKASEMENSLVLKGPEVEAETDLTVTILDVNDEAPAFSANEYEANITENVPNGTPLASEGIFVRDQDSGSNAIFTLELKDDSGLFALSPDYVEGSASVTIRLTKGPLDFENPNQRKFIVLIVAKEISSNEKLSSTATVIINVLNENDEYPSFPEDILVARLSELAPPGTQVAEVQAKDRDLGVFGQEGIVYQLFGDGAERFEVNETSGVVTVASCETPGALPCLDFESKSTYFLSLKATDDEGRGKSAIMSLKVVLQDENDVRPTFDIPVYTSTIFEDATDFDPAFIIKAHDKDVTSQLTYTIVESHALELFRINSSTGQLHVRKPGSFAQTAYLDFTVQVSDSMYNDTTTVNVRVLDENNHHPVFNKTSYTAAVSETAPSGSLVEQVMATDGDLDENAKIKYRIERGSFDHFEIDSQTGVVRVANKLDFDTRSSYAIEIVAVDGGSPALTGTTTLFVNILDDNDKPPVFTPSDQTAWVKEDAPLRHVFHKMTAVDPDISEDSSVVYFIVEPISAVDEDGREVRGKSMFKTFFEINAKTGEVSVKERIDRSIAASVRLTIAATDPSANPPQEGRGTLVVHIMDVNDHPPTFLHLESISHTRLPEELPIGSHVMTVVATDRESVVSHYALEPSSSLVAINNVTGVVTTIARIDYEQRTEFNFTVIAVDAGVPPLTATATVIVSVININDEAPVFNQSNYEAKVLEHSEAGTNIVTISAKDADSAPYGLVSYSLVGENKQHFQIDSTGTISVVDPEYLDRETHPEIILHVVASDLASAADKKTSTVPVRIILEDVNDHPPEFQTKDYKASVTETAPLQPPAPLVQIIAIDKDFSLNAMVSYRIIGGNNDSLFRIDPVSGVLYPAQSLIGKAQVYNLVVEARDMNGTGTFEDTASITLTVQQVNQYKPQFVFPSASNAVVGVPENAEDEQILILTLKAEDKDPGENGRVTYHIKVGEKLVQETAEFSLNPDTGELRTRMTLDREAQAFYELVLVAKDRGLPMSLETLRVLRIEVTDVDDWQPEFPPERRSKVAPYHFKVQENLRPDTAVGQVQATDKDEGDNARIYYHIMEGNEGNWFYMDKTHGFLFTKMALDREERASYDLVVKASNEPQLSEVMKNEKRKRQTMDDPSMVRVHIDVKDENDNMPTFEKADFYAGVEYTANIGRFLLQVKAHDPDYLTNGSLMYYIRSSNLYQLGSNVSSGSVIPSPFNITSDGKLYTDDLMAEYNQDRFILEVAAKEEAPPYREATVRVHVWIYLPEQLLRIVVSKQLEAVANERETLIEELHNATQVIIVGAELKNHLMDDGSLRKDWSDFYVHGVDPNTHKILPINDVIKVVDAHYDLLRAYNNTEILNVLPAASRAPRSDFEPALAALIALLIVLFIGFITFLVVCCCLKHWTVKPPKPKPNLKEKVIKRETTPDILSTTENPLWIEKSFKPYEEQELSMRMVTDLDSPLRTANQAASEAEFSAFAQDPQNHAYATIQKPRRSPPRLRNFSLGEEIGESNDYATLDIYSKISQKSGPQVPGVMSAAAFLQNDDEDGYFRPLDDTISDPLSRSSLTVNKDGEPQLVAELV